MREPALWDLEQLIDGVARPVSVVSTPSVSKRCSVIMPFPTRDSFDDLPRDLRTLIVVGGGTLIDAAKLWRFKHRPDALLVAIPSVWGSGAEATPIASATSDTAKTIMMDERLTPDVRVVIPELAQSLSAIQMRYGYGDCWAHAVEGFSSPLADARLREELVGVFRGMLALGFRRDPGWFHLSAESARGQARSSAGLIHGMAHVLEPPLRTRHWDEPFGHARLCSILAWPVTAFNSHHSDRWSSLCHAHGLDRKAMEAALKALHDKKAYTLLTPLIERLWPDILLDPATRTNGVPVTADHLPYFLDQRFE